MFPSSRGARDLHAAVRRRRFEVQVLAGAPFPNVDHVVTVSIPPCEGGSAGAIPVGQPSFQIAHVAKSRAIGLQNRNTRCESGVRVHISNSPVAQSVRASDFESEG